MPKLRVLCLHAFCLSGNAMRTQMTKFSNFASDVADLAELHYMDGGAEISVEPLPDWQRSLAPPPYYESWNA